MTRTTNTTIRLAVATLASIAALSASNAFAGDTKSTLVGDTKHWQIVKSEKNGEFGQCAARRKQPGPNKIAIVRRDIGWMVQFYNPAWTEQDYRKTSAKLRIQGRKIAMAGKFAVGTSFIFHLGTSDASVAPVARAKWLSFFTERGTKIGYTLRGISEAVNLVADCYANATSGETPVAAVPAAPKANGGAFGEPAPQPKAEPKPEQNANAGAFGAPAPKTPEPANAKPSILNSADTMPIALGYLKDTKSYKLLGKEKGPQGWPVKWELKSGVIGALAVLVNDPITTQNLLASRLEAEKSACKGQFESQTDLKASVSTGEPDKATGMYVCKLNGKKQVGSYTIRTLSPTQTLMILELVNVDLPKQTGPKLVGA
jgi:hypothetical protein